MSDELTRAAEALRTLGERAARDPDFRADLKQNQVELMRAAGMSLVSLARVAREDDYSDEELGQFEVALAELDDSTELRLSRTCIGTCRKQTLWLCGGCQNSFLTT